MLFGLSSLGAVSLKVLLFGGTAGVGVATLSEFRTMGALACPAWSSASQLTLTGSASTATVVIGSARRTRLLTVPSRISVVAMAFIGLI